MEIDYMQQMSANGYCAVRVSSAYKMKSDHVISKYMILALCTRGYIDYEFNMERVHLEAGMRVCYTHVTHARVLERSDDYEVKALLIDYNFSFNCTQGVESKMVQFLFDNPVVPISDNNVVQMIDKMFDALEQYSFFPLGSQNTLISISLVRNILLLLAEHTVSTAVRKQPYSMADTYFRNFINHVTDNVKQEHEVTFYAEFLNITPKYLSEICKQKTGRKAKEIISSILVRSLKVDLISSGKSMKELAIEYGFADQSSMGKFFRKLTGLSPLHYKQHETSQRL